MVNDTSIEDKILYIIVGIMGCLMWGLVFFLTVSLIGCTHISYKDKHGEYERTSFGTNVKLQPLTIKVTKDGNRYIYLEGVDSDQTKAIEAGIKGAVEGAIRGMKGGL